MKNKKKKKKRGIEEVSRGSSGASGNELSIQSTVLPAQVFADAMSTLNNQTFHANTPFNTSPYGLNPPQFCSTPMNTSAPVSVLPSHTHMLNPPPPPPPNPQQNMTVVEKTLQDICSRMGRIESKLNKLDTIEKSLENLESRVNNIDKEVQEWAKKVETNEATNQTIHEAVEAIRSEVKSMNIESVKTKEDLLDVQGRGMRENLMFWGVPENPDENCTEIILNLCQNELKMERVKERVKIDRAHRSGKKMIGQRAKPRPIVAKFHSYEVKEEIRSKSSLLSKTDIGISQQFPKEIYERRKALIPIMKREREKGREVKLVRDRLFINNREYKPT
ncbi:hypothetical protein FSP39_007717 [Pinctada imbricata]|uniref:Uncharacterized protein n=1 Tax=Pinctada imbricata TaxID=66713 RepID=A0AA89BX30_PINIB|nr:hypothetical protein FSP39_007717 [Pinctada imbricata]